MTSNMMNEPFSHIHFTIAILISLIIHITFVIYGNFNINSDGYNKIQSDIELIIIEKPKKESVIIEPSSTLDKSEIIEEEPKEEIIFKEEVIVKIPAQESIPTKKLLANEEDLAISENNIPATQEETEIISTSELISNLGNLDLAPRKELSTNRVKLFLLVLRIMNTDYILKHGDKKLSVLEHLITLNQQKQEILVL